MGKQIEGEVEWELAKLIKEMGRAIREITSFCFPDYIWPNNGEKMIESEERIQLDILKKTIESIILSRDQKQARSMLPYFEEGGAFSAVGFAHLSGVLKELKAQGYELKLIEFSVPLTEVNDFSFKSDSSSSKTEVERSSKSDLSQK